MSDFLKAENLSKAFGRVQAVASVSLDIIPGEILGILGPNGSGKTTLFNLLTGALRPDGGRIVFKGQDITHLPSHRRCRMGIGRTYQIPRPFANMSVFENLLVAATQGGQLRESAARGEVDVIMELAGLTPVRNEFAGRLALLDRKRLETARALATRPSLLLLDEIAGGLTEAEARDVLGLVKQIQKMGITVIWIEHILMMMDGVDRILALDQGRDLCCGGPRAVMSAPEVMQCYLGAEDEG